MENIQSTEDLEVWLRNKPPGYAVTIALRSALRAMPETFSGIRVSHKQRKDLVLSALRAHIITWATCISFSNDISLSAARSAANAAFAAADSTNSIHASRASAATASAAYAADTALAAADTVNGPYALYAATSVSLTSDEGGTLPVQISHDIRELKKSEKVLGSEAILSTPLWTFEDPASFKILWQETRKYLTKNHLSFWNSWYQRRIDGAAVGFALPPEQDLIVQQRLLNKTDDWWDRDFAEVTAEIEGWVEELRPVPHVSTSDFFISYSHNDENIARELGALLEEEGYKITAQYKDFEGGSNFIHEINKGLAKSGRFIPLYSKAYMQSDICQDEWAAAYNMDRGGKERKLLPFLLESAPLNPLQSQIVYKSLMGLSQSERRNAVLEFIDRKPAHYSDADKRVKLAAIVSPNISVNANGQIDIDPNATFDRPIAQMDRQDAIAALHPLLDTLTSDLGKNVGSILAILQNMRENLLKDPQVLMNGSFDRMVSAATKAIAALNKAELDAGQEDMLNSVLELYSQIRTGNDRDDEKRQIQSDIPLDPEQPTQDPIKQSNDAKDEAINLLDKNDLLTEAAADEFRQVIKWGRDKEVEIPSIDENVRHFDNLDTRNFVHNSIGQNERLLAVIAGTASISAHPTIVAVTSLLTESIYVLLKLLL